MTDLELIESFAMESLKQAGELLKIDRVVGRSDLKKAAAAYKPMII